MERNEKKNTKLVSLVQFLESQPPQTEIHAYVSAQNTKFKDIDNWYGSAQSNKQQNRKRSQQKRSQRKRSPRSKPGCIIL